MPAPKKDHGYRESGWMSGIIAAPFSARIAMNFRLLSIAAITGAALLSAPVLADHNSPESLAERVGAIGSLNIVTAEEAAQAAADAAATASASEAETQVAAGPVDGAGVYNTACLACHASGVAGAPKVGDVAGWTDRIAQGMDILYDHAINGYQGPAGVMPAKGGNASLSDEEVRAAVDHMVQGSQ
jgi:cytochrome c5